MTNPMRSYSVTITMTPRQAAEAEDALRFAAVTAENPRLFRAAHRVRVGLLDSGWEEINEGTEDEPRWSWRRTV